jgi:hypothetical protein
MGENEPFKGTLRDTRQRAGDSVSNRLEAAAGFRRFRERRAFAHALVRTDRRTGKRSGDGLQLWRGERARPNFLRFP